MKKIIILPLTAFTLLLIYNAILFIFPLKKNVYYTNEERIEEYVYSKNNYSTVLVGSSLSGAFEDKKLSSDEYFNLYLPFTGAATGLDVIRRSNKIPRRLFIEINHIDRGIDSSLVRSIFNAPVYRVRHYLPFLLTKNKLLPNFIDRVKKPSINKLNAERPAMTLYNELLQKSRADWNTFDTNAVKLKFANTSRVIEQLAAAGCSIYMYEVPMDSSIAYSALMKYQREYFTNFAMQNNYTFIDRNKTETYNTGDGLHLLAPDAVKYTNYFLSELSARKQQ